MKLFTWANVLTLINLFSGSLGCIFYITTQSLELAGVCLLICLVADFLDGLVARLTHTAGPIGVQLDSLADMVSFGLFPSILMFFLLLKTNTLDFGMVDNFIGVANKTILFNQVPLIAFTGILIVLFSALRLAKFNVSDSENTYFRGLNTPTNTLAIYSLAFIEPSNFYVVLGVTVVSCYLLICNIPMFSLKLKNFDWKHDYYLVLFLAICIVGLLSMGIPSIIYLVGIYIILSLIFRKQFAN